MIETPAKDDKAGRDAALDSAIRDRIGADRIGVLTATYRSRGSHIDDEIALAVIAARNREMTAEQRAVFGAIRVVQRAGLRPTDADRQAWRDATPDLPARLAPPESSKPARKSKPIRP